MKLKIILLSLTVALLTACSSNSKQKTDQPEEANLIPVEIIYQVEGMTCDHCEESIQKGVMALPGISLVEANHEDSTTKVIYDPTLTDEKTIAASIEKRGYKVVKN